MNDRVTSLVQILHKLHQGESPEAVRVRIQEELGPLSAEELARAEEQLQTEGIPVAEIQRLSTTLTEIFAPKLKREEDEILKTPGHPAFVFLGENRGLIQFLEEKLDPALQAFQGETTEKQAENLLFYARELKKWIRHYNRKENLLFPYLEKDGITVPPQVMWGVDDVIRDLMGVWVKAIEARPIDEKRISLVAERLKTQLREMVDKEENILMPMLLPKLKHEDWILVAQESVHIGYAMNQGIEGASPSDANTWLAQQTEEKRILPGPKGRIQVPSGSFTEEELTAMLNTLPTDLTFADADDIIRYYSEGKHQVFTRTRTILGRDLYLCHPPNLIPTIKKLIQDFKDGVKDQMIVPMRRGNRLDLVRYYAVRDEEGKFLGTLEVTEEMSEILELLEEKPSH